MNPMEEDDLLSFFNDSQDVPDEFKCIAYVDLGKLADTISKVSTLSEKLEILQAAASTYMSVIQKIDTFLDNSEATVQENGMYNSYHNYEVYENPENFESYNFGISQTRAYRQLSDCIRDLENRIDISPLDLIVGVNYSQDANSDNILEKGFESIFKSKYHLRYAINVGADSVKVKDGRFETIFTHKLEYTHRQERARLKAWWFALKKSNYLRREFLALSFEDISRLLDDYFIFESPLSKTGHFFKDSKCEDPELERVYANILSSKVF